jgi:hypothetical protein
MTKNKPNKFDELKRDDLLRLVLEMEDELETLRPKPARFKLGQLVAFRAPNQYWKGQPAVYFSVLSTELRNGEWFYGHSRSGPQTFVVYPEKKCRELTQTELDGTPAVQSNEPQDVPPAMQASAPGMGLPGGLGYPTGNTSNSLGDFE